MRKTFTIVLTVSLILLAASLQWVISDDSKSERERRNMVDTRVDNNGYYKRLAEQGLYTLNPDIRTAQVVYTGSKINAYSVLNDVCRIPTHLFQFIRYCEDISGNETGWGRAHRKVISDWYKSFIGKDQSMWNHPLRLAYLVTKYKRRYGFCHRDVIRLAHVKARQKSIRITLQYALRKPMETPNEYDESKVVHKFLEAVEYAKHCCYPEDEEELCELIAVNRLSREHVPNRFLRDSVKVWNVLIRDMPIAAMIRNLSKVCSLNIQDTELVNLFIHLVEQKLGDHEALRRSGVHPLQLLIAMKHYNLGNSSNGRLTWTVNPRISEALENAFYNCPTVIPASNRRYLMAVSVGENMQQTICRSSIKASEAAAAMILSTVKIQNTNVEAIVFTNKIEDAYIANINPQDTLQTIEQKIFEIPRETHQPRMRQDLSVPFKWAFKRKERFDAVIVFTDSIHSCGDVHPAEAVKFYSQYMAVPNYKFVSVAMTSDRYTIVSPDDSNSLDVVGFDIHTPGVIMKFLNDFEGQSLPHFDEDNIIDIH